MSCESIKMPVASVSPTVCRNTFNREFIGFINDVRGLDGASCMGYAILVTEK